MKVCIVATGYPRYRGDWSHVYLHSLAQELVRQGAEIHVVAPHAKGLQREQIMDGVRIHRFQYMYPESLQTLAYSPGIPENVKKFHNKLEIAPFMTSMTGNVLNVTRKYDIEVINAHWAIPSGFLAVLAKKIHRKPIMLTLYGAELYLAGNASYLRYVASYAITNADKVVGISDSTCEAAQTISRRQDIDVLPDGIDTERFRSLKDRNEIRRLYGVDGHLIFASGRMVERKGFRYLIEATRYIVKDFPNTKLIIGGDGPERDSLEKLISEYDLKDQIVLPGFIPHDEFPGHMAASNVFILPSIVDSRGDTEGSATILLEAMACGTPVVGTRVGGIPYAIKDGEGGYLVDEKNPRQLAERIIMLLKNDNLRRVLGEKGRRYVEEKFSQAEIAGRYIQAFESLIDKALTGR